MKLFRSLLFKKNYKWFDRNRKRIVSEHEGEYVLISQNRMWGYYNDIGSAIKDAKKRGFIPGRYMIHECQMEEQVYYL